MKHLIIGGVAGGATAAARLRRLSEHDEIILFEKGPYISYANCGLPYYIGDVIKPRNKLFVQTVQGIHQRFCIDVRTNQEVIAIDRSKKEVSVKKTDSGEVYTESYDKLIMAPGAEPVRPPLEGIDNPKIFTLRNVDDTDRIKSFIDTAKPKHAVVIGGGFIGLEMTENLYRQGIRVHLVEMSKQVMPPLDFAMSAIIHHHLNNKGILLTFEDGVDHFETAADKLVVLLKSGKKIITDFALLSIGIRPDVSLAKAAGLTIGITGGIQVNQHMQTSDPDIYAVGDAVEVLNTVINKPALIALAGPANKQARIAADHIILNPEKSYPGSIGTNVAKIFDLTAGSAGSNVKTLKKENIPHSSSYVHLGSHAGYYPDAQMMCIKILFAPDTGRLLGAHIVGMEGVDKRIEMCAEVIKRNGTIYDLTVLEHAYAPPYSSAKDPVNIAGFVAENILNKLVQTIQWHELKDLPDDVVKIDVRTPDEIKSTGAMPGFINIPVDELRDRMQEIPKDKPIILTCAIGLRGYIAYRILTQNGYADVRNLSGGYRTWYMATTPVKDFDSN